MTTSSLLIQDSWMWRLWRLTQPHCSGFLWGTSPDLFLGLSTSPRCYLDPETFEGKPLRSGSPIVSGVCFRMFLCLQKTSSFLLQPFCCCCWVLSVGSLHNSSESPRRSFAVVQGHRLTLHRSNHLLCWVPGISKMRKSLLLFGHQSSRPTPPPPPPDPWSSLESKPSSGFPVSLGKRFCAWKSFRPGHLWEEPVCLWGQDERSRLFLKLWNVEMYHLLLLGLPFFYRGLISLLFLKKNWKYWK